MDKLTIQDLTLTGKKVLIRVDYNVPLNKDGTISDDSRIKESLPTLEYALKTGAAVILISHLGRPQSRKDIHLSLGVCAKRLSKLIASPVFFAPDCIGKEVERMVEELKGGQVLLLENLRFYPAEENPSLDLQFAKQLSKGMDYFINDAFGTAHRIHSSTVMIEQYFPGRAAMGFLIQKEIQFLKPLLDHPKLPFHVIIGGAKVSTKIGVLKSFINHVSAFFIGGGMALLFLKAQGLEIELPHIGISQINEAQALIQACEEKNIPLHLPVDLVIAEQFRNDAPLKTLSMPSSIPIGWNGMDIGSHTIQLWIQYLQQAATVFWNGPLGVFEFPQFAQGTKSVAECLAQLDAVKVIGGGDLVAAIQSLHLSKKFTHISTGGGAALEYLEQTTLPGIEALSVKEPHG